MHRKEGEWRAVLACSDRPAAGLESIGTHFLHPVERAQLAEQPLRKGREDFLRSRYVVKQALVAYGHPEASTKVYVRHGIFRQPILQAQLAEPLGLSISHTHAASACLVFPEEHPMGIDLEKPTLVIKQHFEPEVSEGERKLHRRAYEAEHEFYTRLWTIKEGLSKVLKTGLTVPLRLFEVETLAYAADHTTAYYKHFGQYKAISFWLYGSLCSIVLPRESTLAFPLVAVRLDDSSPK
jgi:phosphopantetheinyl transferase